MTYPMVIFQKRISNYKKASKKYFRGFYSFAKRILKNETFLEFLVFQTDISDVFGLVRFHFSLNVQSIGVAKVIIIKLGRKQH